MRRARVLAAALVAASPAFLAYAREDARIAVDVLVLDREGNPVTGLSQDDFEITVGKQVRPVIGARMALADRDPRRFVFVVNRRGAKGPELRRMKEGIESFFSTRFGERDEALFVDFAEVPRITRGWRVGPNQAAREISNMIPIGFPSALGPAEDAADAAFMLQALAARLVGVQGRKVVVMFSRSLTTFGGSPGGTRGLGRAPSSGPGSVPDLPAAQRNTDDAAEHLARAFNAARVAIYAIHLEGARRHENGILIANRDEFVAGSTITTRTWISSPARRARDALARPADDFLSSLASETGGAYTARATDFARVLDRIETSNRLWYELAFEPAGTDIPGQYQPHEVRLRNRSGLTVIVRPGHVVPH
ncbi:MAG: VWA domain-containing protein [Acidobacteriota bacterium]|nr:VWA domain-containing protein [Acidobacteriota bacterium]